MNEETMKKLLQEMKNELKQAIEDSKEDLKKEISGIRKKMTEIESENQRIGRDVEELREENERMKSRLRQMEDYSRRDNILISGIKKEEDETDEDLVVKVEELAKSLGIPIKDYDINACHRLPVNNNEDIPNTIVKLNNRSKRSKMLQRSKECKIEGIYISPHLAKETAEIHKEARRGRKEGIWKFTWINEKQQIFIRKKEGTPALKISNREQLREVEERLKAEGRTDERMKTRAQTEKTTKSSENIVARTKPNNAEKQQNSKGNNRNK